MKTRQILLKTIFLLLVVLQGVSNTWGIEKPLGRYSRIISFAPSITEILFELGGGDKVVGVTRFCDYPQEAQKKQRIGDHININYEVVLALKPDLIIHFPENKEVSKFAKKFNIDAVSVKHDSIKDINNSIEIIGEKAGVSKRAGEINQRINNGISQAAKIADNQKIIIVFGKDISGDRINSVYLAGKNNFYNDIIKIIGGENGYKGSVAYPSVSVEGLLYINPDIIIDIVTGGKNAPDYNQIETQWKQVFSYLGKEQAKQKKIIVIDDDYAVIPGPRILKLLDKLSWALSANDR